MFKQLAKHPRKTLVGLTTVIAASAVAVGSGASFTSQTANPTNTFSSGILTQSNTKAGENTNGVSIVTGANLKPGDVRTGTVTIKNTGSIAGVFKLSEVNDSTTFGAGMLDLVIDDVTVPATPKNVFTGDFGSAGEKALGTFAADEARTYRFTVTFDANAGNAEFQKSATADYQWDAVQAP